jgi:4-hydroxy-tetrahydrodipicolinate synthase
MLEWYLLGAPRAAHGGRSIVHEKLYDQLPMGANPHAADPQSIRGAITPLVTPFTADGGIDLDAIPRLIDWQLANGTHGISVGGSTGEPTSQTVAERIAVMRAAAAAIDGRCPFLPGTGSALMSETLELTAEAERLGASGALVVTPYYGRPQQQGLYDWYARVANEFPDLPLLVYNVPIRAAVDIAPVTVARLRRDFANIVGIKETTKDFEHVSYVLDRCGADFIALSGIELLCYPMLCLGGRGHLSCVANFAPRPVADLYDAFAAGDHDRARALHYDLHALVDAAFAETNPVPAKWVMERLGLVESGFAREPLAPLSEAGVARVTALLDASPHVELPAVAA